MLPWFIETLDIPNGLCVDTLSILYGMKKILVKCVEKIIDFKILWIKKILVKSVEEVKDVKKKKIICAIGGPNKTNEAIVIFI